ncbi:MAG: glycine cleavage system aminomethyltransferase GcvT [Proteobacteria bacterium]|nr:glycine cleavage system aminomethyltransferase GcvT [Pseudomonadota bacterium]
MKKTPLYDNHQQLGAVFINFSDWLMPLHYGSQVNEHHLIRQDAGVFDVSHMAIIDVDGVDAMAFLQRVLANDVQKLSPGKALYSCMLNAGGGVLDDLIVYCLDKERYRLIVNAATQSKDLSWLGQHAAQYVANIHHRQDLALLAIQGPKTFEKMRNVLTPDQFKAIEDLRPFHLIEIGEWCISRTGYTGEVGLEIMLGQNQVQTLWQDLLANEIKPAGLGARDTLRLEAGYNLYGQDMDETVTPLESNLAWTVDWKDPTRDFIGKEALQKKQQKGIHQQLVGLVLLEKGVCRASMPVYVQFPNLSEVKHAKLTSGGFSPTLGCGIGLARLPTGELSSIEVGIRDKKVPAKIVPLPFVKNGKPNFN